MGKTGLFDTPMTGTQPESSRWLEIIYQRKSCRTFDPRPLRPEDRRILEQCLTSDFRSPFGETSRFRLLDLDTDRKDRESARRLGTYGVIRGASCFLAGIMRDLTRGPEDMGFCMETVLLHAGRLGLGTCWLGATFRSGRIAEDLGLSEDESIPAVSPLGYPAAKESVTGSLFKLAARSARRKSPDTLFFSQPGRPLSPEEAEPYRHALEAVRMAPSSRNGQPWRLIIDTKRGIVHFYSNGKAGRRESESLMRRIDMGIAACHFELAMRGLNGGGRWEHLDGAAVPGWTYFISRIGA